MTEANAPVSDVILDSLNDGVYVCDRERRIVYWSKSAERITGWTADEVVGRCCHDGVLAHVDQDGRRLCGHEFCPLHRSMVTNSASNVALTVYGLTKSGERVPMTVSVAPIHDAQGQVVGGVETFRDFSETHANLQRAKRIQTLSMEHQLPRDDRVGFASIYLPHDMVGGDYFALRALDADHYGFLLADVMGHGVAAALHTMHLSALWERNFHALTVPAEFAGLLNRELCQVVKYESFATALCGVVDAAARTVRFVSAGGPGMLLVHPDGGADQIAASGLPLGATTGADYQEEAFACAPGDALLMFTDGATEIHDASGDMLGAEGLLGTLKTMGYPRTPLNLEALQKALLNFSNGIRLADDLTLLEARFS
ncbi:MAG: SpoIIE family protein phosphatase [Betaproteobacteria bacterium]|nr:SpoIIE family protein phosphatase [Betaproteobacteria bacterium]